MAFSAVKENLLFKNGLSEFYIPLSLLSNATFSAEEIMYYYS